MDKLRGLLGIRRMETVLNARIRELFRVKKGLDEKIDEVMLQWRGWKVIGLPREYVVGCAGSRLMGRPRK